MRLLDFATTIYVVARTYLQFLLSSLSMLQAVDVLLYLASYDGFLYFHSEVPLGRYHTSSIISKHFLLLLRQGSGECQNFMTLLVLTGSQWKTTKTMQGYKRLANE